MYHGADAKQSCEIYAVEVCSRSQIFLRGQINGSIKIMVLQIAQYTKLCSEFRIVSEIIIKSSGGLSHLFERTARVVEFGNFWPKSADQSSLEDQDKQQLSFFVIRFTVKYSDRLVATAGLKVFDFLCHAKGSGICPPVTPAL